MKQIAVVLLLAVALLGPVHAAADNEFNGAPDLAGFRGMKWGANVTDFQGLVKLNDDPFVQRYSKKNDRLQIDGVGLESIIYNFYKGRLHGSQHSGRGADEWKKLKGLIFDKFGPAPNISAASRRPAVRMAGSPLNTHLQFIKSKRACQALVCCR